MVRGVTIALNHQHKTFDSLIFKFLNGARHGYDLGVKPPKQRIQKLLNCQNRIVVGIKTVNFAIRIALMIFKFPDRNGLISTSQLSTLLRLHLKPINLVIF